MVGFVEAQNESLTALDFYYNRQNSLTRECLLALKSIILSVNAEIVPARKYQIPFFCYRNFNLGFLWVNRKKILVGFVEDRKILPQPIAGKTKDNVTFLEINPLEDIPIEEIQNAYKKLIERYNMPKH
jgi:hypothetical protein